MRELTVENIKQYMEADASAFDGVKGFGAISETSTLCLCIDFLIRETELYAGLLEAEQEDCQLQRTNKNLQWERAETATIELGRIEKQTAEKCAEIATRYIKGVRDFDKGYNESSQQSINSIRQRFNLKETP